MSQDSDNTMKIPVNAPRLADRMEKIRKFINLHIYKEKGEEQEDHLEVTEVEHHGKIVGRYVKHGDTVVQAGASHDAQASGLHEEVAKKAGIKKEDIVHTSPTESALSSAESAEKDDRQDGTGEVERADLGKGSSKEVKPKKKPSEGSKPDNSMSKMASQESAETQGAPDLTKSYESLLMKMSRLSDMCKSINKDPAKLDRHRNLMENKHYYGQRAMGATHEQAISSVNKMRISAGLPPHDPSKVLDPKLKKAYKIDAKPGEITYTKVKPEELHEPRTYTAPTQTEPKWKQDWKSKTVQERMDIRKKLAAQRNTPVIKKSESMSKFEIMSKLAKNVAAGYPSMGIPPAGVASDQMPVPDMVMSLEKDVIDFKTRKKIGETGGSDVRSRDEKISDALAAQAKKGSPYATPGPGGGGSSIMPSRSRPTLKGVDSERMNRIHDSLDRIKNNKANVKRQTLSDKLFELDRKLKEDKMEKTSAKVTAQTQKHSLAGSPASLKSNSPGPTTGVPSGSKPLDPKGHMREAQQLISKALSTVRQLKPMDKSNVKTPAYMD